MASELDNEPQLKRQKSHDFDQTLCVFCGNVFNEADTAIKPDINRMDKLFHACQQRQDDVGKRLLEHEAEIRQREVSFRYHSSCRASYSSNYHIQWLLKKQSVTTNTAEASTSASEKYVSRITRQGTCESHFEWKTNCFVCGKPCHRQRKSEWAMVAGSISTEEETMYSKVARAAKDRNDAAMLIRLGDVHNGDLVAKEARYHRKQGCYVSYIKTRNVELARKRSRSKESIYDTAVNQLVDEVAENIENKHVFTQATLLSRYQELLIDNGMGVIDAERYTSQKLKSKLQSKCPNLAFVSRNGLSDLVCSADITVGDALHKAGELYNTVKETADYTYSQPTNTNNETNTTDISSLHTVAGILRKRIMSTEKLNSEYYSSDEMSLSAEHTFVDPLLYQLMVWLTDSEKYTSGALEEGTSLNSKCLHFACDITTAATGIMSPKHMGLAVHLHNDFGSRKLIDTMYNLGYTISYTEVRQFNTSVAQYVSSLQVPTHIGSYIPPEFMPVPEGGSFIVAAADNWDHNERTVDGKQTTHAMTSILVQPETGGGVIPTRIKRTSSRSLDLTGVVGCELKSTLVYNKPTKRPEPVFVPPVTMKELLDEVSDQVQDATLLEKVYNISRSGELHSDADDQMCVPPWKRFHSILSKGADNEPTSRIAFNPIIMAPPTNFDTVFTTLMRLKETANTLGQTNVPIFFDMGLLTKALEIVWSKPMELDGVIPCEGGMHLMMSVFSAVGYVYGDAGLKQLLHDSGVFAVGTVNMMLSGRDFDRAMYGIKLVDEALHSRFYHQFVRWCSQSNKEVPDDLLALLNRFENAVSEENEDGIACCLSELRTGITDDLEPLLEEFVMTGRAVSPTFRFWYDLMKYVLQPIKLFISSTRVGNWNVQQNAKLQLLPLLFVANRMNYARYLTVNILLMNRLPADVLTQFQDGNFVAKLTSGRFNSVWLDYTIEVTENKALKGTGGIIGLTLRGPALARWFLARPIASQYAMKFTENVASTAKGVEQGSKETPAEKRWSADVKKMFEMFDSSFIDPFDVIDAPERLVNIATGAITPAGIEESLVAAIDKGTAMLNKFVKERLVDPVPGEDHDRKSLYDALPRSALKTMSEMKKSVKVKKKNVTIDGEVMYLRLLAVNAKKRVPLARVLSYENAPVPLSMFTEDGKMVSSAKSHLMPSLEGMATSEKITSLAQCDAIVFDGHACIQLMIEPTQHVAAVTFEAMANSFFNYILCRSKLCNSGHPVQQIHVVFDKYPESSIKDQTREKRTAGVHGSAIQVRPDIRIPPNWKQFLSNCRNKSSLAQFYTTHMCNNGMQLDDDQVLLISGGQEDKMIEVTKTCVTVIPDLETTQEEADTRIVLHTVEASRRGAKTIVISSPDTDVLVLLVHHRLQIVASSIFMLTGRTGKYASLVRYIPVHEIYDTMSPPQRILLLPMYCLTGCDTTSSFFGHGKKSAFRIIVRKLPTMVHWQHWEQRGTIQHTVDTVHEVCWGDVWQERVYISEQIAV